MATGMVQCPNGGRCGYQQHRQGSKQYKECLARARGGVHSGQGQIKPVLKGAGHDVEPSESQMDMARMSDVDMAKEARRKIFNAREIALELDDEELRERMDDGSAMFYAAQHELSQLESEFEAKKRQYDILRATDTINTPKIHQASEELYEAKVALDGKRAELDDARAVTAEYARESGDRFLSGVQKSSPDMLPGSSMVELEEGDVFTSGIGGRDANVIINGSRGDVAEWMNEKIDGKKPETQAAKRSLARGNAWEGEILRRFNEKSGMTVLAPPGLMKDLRDPSAVFAVDGLVADDNGNIVGVIEAKSVTVTDNTKASERWESGPPERHILQAKRYASKLGLQKAIVAGVINDGEMKYYEYDVNDPVDRDGNTIADYDDKFREMHQKIRFHKENPNEPRPKAPKRRGTSTYAPDVNDSSINQLAAWNGTSYRSAQKTLARAMKGASTPRAKREAMSDLLRSSNPLDRKTPIVYLDFEMTGFSPGAGARIIQSGIVISHPDGREEVIDELHGIDPRDLYRNGTGAQDVHGISPDMIRGKEPFHKSHAQRRLRDMVDEGAVFVGANAQAVEGVFARSGNVDMRPERIVDTMWHSRNVEDKQAAVDRVAASGASNPDLARATESRGGALDMSDKLSGFAERNGVFYDPELSHNALGDAQMTKRAFENFVGTFRESGRRRGSSG